MKTTPRIYIACLASYNAGKLHGKWIDAAQDIDAIQLEISEMLKASPEHGAEEWAMHDYEGFGEISFSEWPDLNRLSTIANLIEEYEDAFTVWYSSEDGNYHETDDLETNFQEAYQGVHNSKEDFAHQLLDDCGQLQEIPENLRNYFDYEAYARDLELGGDFSFIRHDGQFYVFSRN